MNPRFPLRLAGFVGLTAALYGGLEVDTWQSSLADRELVLRKWIERYGHGLLKLYGVEVKAEGPHVGEGHAYPGHDARGVGRVFMMNHRSAYDIAIGLAHLDATFVSRADLADWPVIGVAARRVGTLFVDRESKQSRVAVVSAMSRGIHDGKGIMVFPEGTTFAGDELRPLKPGGFLAAIRTQCEIVPVGLAYDAEGASFGDESFPEHLKRISGQAKTRVALVAGAPIRASADDDIETLEKTVAEAMTNLIGRARRIVDG